MADQIRIHSIETHNHEPVIDVVITLPDGTRKVVHFRAVLDDYSWGFDVVIGNDKNPAVGFRRSLGEKR